MAKSLTTVLSDTDIEDYVNICRHLGGYSDLIQGSGGNISVKSANEIVIKSSGKILAETTLTSGYVICSIEKLLKKLDNKNESTIDCFIRGDQNISPSMEVFFHLLPFKWIVHLHPTFLLEYLCSINWKDLAIENFSYAHIPYKTPGIELCTYILENYNGEQVIFLQNHGIILCSNTIDEIYTMIDLLYNNQATRVLDTLCINSAISNEVSKSRYLLKQIQLIDNTLVNIKKCKMHNFFDRLFLPITPDIRLFLKDYPLIQENISEDINILLEKYYKLNKSLPSVIKLLNSIYVIGKSYKQCLCIEEILESYITITSKIPQNNIVFIEENNIKSLIQSEKEKHRLELI